MLHFTSYILLNKLYGLFFANTSIYLGLLPLSLINCVQS